MNEQLRKNLADSWEQLITADYEKKNVNTVIVHCCVYIYIYLGRISIKALSPLCASYCYERRKEDLTLNFGTEKN